MNDLKILVGCHQPCKCPDIVKNHPDIYIPILGGAAVSGVEPFWPGMIRDDIMDNISWMNPYYSEYTCLYWAWKNYDMIGNPEYIGFNQYGRLFNDIDYIKNNLDKNIAYVSFVDTELSVYDHLIFLYGRKILLDNISREFGFNKADNIFNILFNYRTFPFCSIFVAHRSVFDKLMNFLSFMMLDSWKYVEFCDACSNKRYMSFIFERMMGFYFMYLQALGQVALRHHTFTIYKSEEIIYG